MLTDEEVTKKFAEVRALLDKQHDRLTRLLRLSDKALDSIDHSRSLVKHSQSKGPGTP